MQIVAEFHSPLRREEFKRHKKADAKWLTMFYREWNQYVAQMEQQSPIAGPVGSNLPGEAVKAMTDEQKIQLLKLREAAAKPYKDG